MPYGAERNRLGESRAILYDRAVRRANGIREREWVLLAWSPNGYQLRERSGEPPSPGSSIQEGALRLEVVKIGASPLPGDRRPCVYTAGA
jgi:hypothetical protein